MTVINAELNREAGQIEVRFEYDKHVLESVRKVPGAKFTPPHKGGPFWRCPVDTTTVKRLQEAFPEGNGHDLKLGVVLKAWGRKRVGQETELRSLSTADDAALKHLPKRLPELMKFIEKSKPPRPYQRADIAYMAQTDCINANQPGLGKTIETIGAIYEAGIHKGAKLVVAPKTSLDVVWEFELTRFGQKQPVFIMSGDDSQEARLEMLTEAYQLAEQDKDFWFVTTASSIRFITEGDETGPAYPELHEIIWSVVVFDEYHKMGLSNPKTNLFKAANALEAQRKFLLSGTPMGGKPIKLWGALHFLDPQRFTSKWRWAGEWLEIEEEEYESQGEERTSRKIHGVKDGREDEFWAHLAPYMIRRTKKEVNPQLPDKQYVEVWCEMTPRQQKQYDAMALNGTLRVKPTADSGKLPQVMRLLEERGITGNADEDEGDEKVVISSQFKMVADMVHEQLTSKGIDAIRLKGSKNKRSEQVRTFQEEGGPRVMVMTTTMGGVSITLHRASTVIILDETWDPDDQEQLEDRVHGRGKLNNVTVYYLRSKNSIEEYIQQVTFGKSRINQDILDLRRQGFRATKAK
jgi:SNF2 family DNA or RNA helicase